eukprot:s296_g24.t1
MMAHGFRRRWNLKRDADAQDIDGPGADDERVRSRSPSFSMMSGHRAFDLDPDIEGGETDMYEYEPSLADTAPPPRVDTLDAFACSSRDISASTSSAFLSNVRASDLKQPWEVGPMKFLFDDDVYDSMRLGMPLAWDASNAPKELLNQNPKPSEPGPQFPKPCQTMNCILAIKDTTFWQDRNAVMLRAVKKWLFILNLDRSASSCGAHLDEALSEDDEKPC